MAREGRATARAAGERRSRQKLRGVAARQLQVVSGRCGPVPTPAHCARARASLLSAPPCTSSALGASTSRWLTKLNVHARAGISHGSQRGDRVTHGLARYLHVASEAVDARWIVSASQPDAKRRCRLEAAIQSWRACYVERICMQQVYECFVLGVCRVIECSSA